MLKQVTYQGVFELAADGGFSVYFPDLPGCTSYGATLDEAQKNARDALGLHLYGMEKDGDPIPAPSTTPEVYPETAPGYVVDFQSESEKDLEAEFHKAVDEYLKFCAEIVKEPIFFEQ